MWRHDHQLIYHSTRTTLKNYSTPGRILEFWDKNQGKTEWAFNTQLSAFYLGVETMEKPLNFASKQILSCFKNNENISGKLPKKTGEILEKSHGILSLRKSGNPDCRIVFCIFTNVGDLFSCWGPLCVFEFFSIEKISRNEEFHFVACKSISVHEYFHTWGKFACGGIVCT